MKHTIGTAVAIAGAMALHVHGYYDHTDPPLGSTGGRMCAGNPQDYTFHSLPYAEVDDGDEVAITFQARADLDALDEWIVVEIGDTLFDSEIGGPPSGNAVNCRNLGYRKKGVPADLLIVRTERLGRHEYRSSNRRRILRA